MKELLEKIKEKESGTLTMSEKKWFNGHAYLPLYLYHLTFGYKTQTVDLKYEFRQNEFSKPSAIGGGAFSDRHLCHIKCSFDSSLPDFSIDSRTLLSRLLNKNPKVNFRVKCKDTVLQKSLSINTPLSNIFKIVEESAEFSPLIVGKLIKNSHYQINIDYNTQIEKQDVIVEFLDFLKSIIK
jgi:hypothetical protein